MNNKWRDRDSYRSLLEEHLVSHPIDYLTIVSYVGVHELNIVPGIIDIRLVIHSNSDWIPICSDSIQFSRHFWFPQSANLHQHARHEHQRIANYTGEENWVFCMQKSNDSSSRSAIAIARLVNWKRKFHSRPSKSVPLIPYAKLSRNEEQQHEIVKQPEDFWHLRDLKPHQKNVTISNTDLTLDLLDELNRLHAMHPNQRRYSQELLEFSWTSTLEWKCRLDASESGVLVV